MGVRVSSRSRRWLISLVAIGIVAAFAAAAVGVAVATEQSLFCTSCHEMQPFHEAWADGPHANVACVDCHVQRGFIAHLEHKIVALAEVRSHFFGEPTFPLATAPEVPDERCVGCHTNVIVARPGFSHDEHAEEGPCQSCHSDTGHDVAARALGRAGVLNEVSLRARAGARIAVVGKGSANLVGHVPTACQTCHDMKATACESCHAPGHAPRKQDCGTCHKPGPAFVFSHPASPACAECHVKPATHADDACSRCHPQPGVTWAFDHDPTAGADCERCHKRPDQHRPGACSTCHASGASWAFSHPSSKACADCHAAPARHFGADCARCHTPTVPFARTTLEHPGAGATCTTCHKAPAGHSSSACATCHPKVGASWAFAHPSSNACTGCHKAPAGHSTAACATCHRAGSSWAFSHPGGSANCTACHAQPAGHPGGPCTTCHRVSANWAFYHPSSTNCASCHGAPANHYGTSCASCHSVGATWASATFRHPAVPGGEHTYRSFACGNCHPSGYSSATCIKCHDSPTGPTRDD